jgi:peptidoglycan hydrolase-like protein with peptidoglycan-binding domain
MRRLSLFLLAILLVSCANQPVVAPTTAPAPVPTALPVATSVPVPTLTSVPTPQPTSALATEVVPTVMGRVVPTTDPAQPEPTVSTEPIQEPPGPLVQPPFERTIQLEKPAMQGDDVSAVQRRLLALGYTQLGTADGIFGVQSALAVSAFQKQNSLDVDGIVGQKTWERLFSPNPIAADGVSPIVPIVDSENNWLLGASRDGRWVGSIDAGPLMVGGEEYSLYQPDGTVVQVTGTQPGSLGIPCEDTPVVILSQNPTQGIAVGGPWDARTGPIAAGDLQDPQLLSSIGKLLKANGIDKPEVKLVQVLEADLNGDGIVEQVVVATRMDLSESGHPSPDAAAGDYSLVAVVGKDGPPVVIIGEYHPQAAEFSAPSVNNLVDLLDLNDDGKLEIIVASRYYEGNSTLVYTYTNSKAELVIGAGCGV